MKRMTSSCLRRSARAKANSRYACCLSCPITGGALMACVWCTIHRTAVETPPRRRTAVVYLSICPSVHLSICHVHLSICHQEVWFFEFFFFFEFGSSNLLGVSLFQTGFFFRCWNPTLHVAGHPTFTSNSPPPTLQRRAGVPGPNVCRQSLGRGGSETRHDFGHGRPTVLKRVQGAPTTICLSCYAASACAVLANPTPNKKKKSHAKRSRRHAGWFVYLLVYLLHCVVGV
jgi:hypothetical protein